MKVLQILPELNSGGVERGTLEIARALTAAGHEAVVVSHGGRLVPALEAVGARHVTRPVHRKSLLSLWQTGGLRKLFAEEKPDIVHARSRAPAWLAWLALRGMEPAARPRFVTTVHGFYSVNLYSKIMTRGERVIAVSESVARQVAADYRVEPSRLRVIHRGVAPEEFPRGYQPNAGWLARWHEEYPQTRGRVLITLPGRITRWKGHEDFLEIIRRLRAEGRPVHGLVVGETHPKKQAYRAELAELAKKAGVAADVTFTGQRSDVREIMAISAAVLSLSSEPEAFGRTTLEALSLGRPVAAYDHGGVGEQLAALLPAGRVPPGDCDALTALLSGWLRDGAPAPLVNVAFTLAAMQARTLQVYAEVLAGGATGARDAAPS